MDEMVLEVIIENPDDRHDPEIPSDDPYIVISADCHAGAPPEIISQYIDADFRESYAIETKRLQHMKVEHGEELQRWAEAGGVEAKGDLTENLRIFLNALKSVEGYWNPDQWLASQEQDGVVASVIYPTARLWEPVPFETSSNPAERMAGRRAYNRWLADFCSAMPGRAAGVILLPDLDNLETVLAEIREVHARGLWGGILLPVMSHDLPGYHDRYWDPLWGLCEELSLPLNTHAGLMRPPVPPLVYGQERGVSDVLENYDSAYFVRRHLSFMIYGGVFERFPGLKTVVTENLAQWVPVEIQNLDGQFREMFYTAGIRSRLTLSPREYWQRNCFIGASFLSRSEATARHAIGIDKMMWGSDYPHPEGSHPYTTLSLKHSFSGIPSEDLRPILGENAMRVYGFDPQLMAQLARKYGPTPAEVDVPLEQVPENYVGFAFRTF